MATAISARAIDLIVGFEVSSRGEYERKYQNATWPGGKSGITVGIGYDLGYCSLDKLHADWDGRLSTGTIRQMQRCLGVTGPQARDLLPAVSRLILVPWDAAYAVFAERDIPEWTDRVCKALPGAASLPPDSLGALVSLAYNRGASFDKDGERYIEMRNIKRWMISDELGKIPGEIRTMKRLWGPDQAGLLTRRDREAALFAEGLIQQLPKRVPPPDAPKVIPPSPPDVPPAPAPEPRNWLAALIGKVLSLFTPRK